MEDFPYPWGIKKIDADIVWPKTKGKGVRVAVLDTGIDSGHRNLQANVKRGVSCVENVTSDHDDNGHGTHCAGIIAANLPSGRRSPNGWIYGVAPEASIFPVKVLNYNGDGLLSAILSGLEWCLHNKMDIVSMSFRIRSDSPSQALQQACMTLWQRGLLLVAATGNDCEDKKRPGRRSLTVGYPAQYDSVLGIGATDKLDTIAPFKQYWQRRGPSGSRRRHSLHLSGEQVSRVVGYKPSMPTRRGGCRPAQVLPKGTEQRTTQDGPTAYGRPTWYGGTRRRLR